MQERRQQQKSATTDGGADATAAFHQTRQPLRVVPLEVHEQQESSRSSRNGPAYHLLRFAVLVRWTQLLAREGPPARRLLRVRIIPNATAFLLPLP